MRAVTGAMLRNVGHASAGPMWSVDVEKDHRQHRQLTAQAATLSAVICRCRINSFSVTGVVNFATLPGRPSLALARWPVLKERQFRRFDAVRSAGSGAGGLYASSAGENRQAPETALGTSRNQRTWNLPRRLGAVRSRQPPEKRKHA